MKFNINSKVFGNALAQLQRIISPKNALAILDCFKIEMLDSCIKITASDNDTSSAVVTLDCETEGAEGAFCVNAKRLTNLIKSFKNGLVCVETDGEQGSPISVKCGKSKYELTSVSASEYPNRTVEEPNSIELGMDLIVRGFNSVKNAVSFDTIRPVLCGVYVDATAESIAFVATDTHKILVYHDANNNGNEFRFVIPTKSVNLILSLMSKSQSVTLEYNSKSVVFKGDGVVFTTTLIQGNYPPYQRVINPDTSIEVKVNRVEMLDALNRVSGFAEDSTDLIVVQSDGMFGNIMLTAKDVNYQVSGVEELNGECNGSIKIGFNASHLFGVINSLSESDITLKLSDASRPMKLNEGNITAIVMPMQIIE